MKLYTQLSNFYNKLMMSECLENCLDLSMPILITFYMQFLAMYMIVQMQHPSLYPFLLALCYFSFFPKQKIHLQVKF